MACSWFWNPFVPNGWSRIILPREEALGNFYRLDSSGVCLLIIPRLVPPWSDKVVRVTGASERARELAQEARLSRREDLPLLLPLTFSLIPPPSFYRSIALPPLLATSRRSPSQSCVSHCLKSDIRGHESAVSSCIVHLFICSCFIMHFIARLFVEPAVQTLEL